MVDYVVRYDNEASGPFTELGANLTWAGGSGFLVTLVDDGTTGKLYFSLLSGTPPADNDTITQGLTTADANGAAEVLRYPVYMRDDVAVAANGNITWTGQALGHTHSCRFDGQTVNLTLNDTLTFGNGATAELIAQTDAGATGEIFFRMITGDLPADNDTISDEGTGDGNVNGITHERSYTPLHLHRLLSDLNDDPNAQGDDLISVLDPTPSSRSTDEIVALLGTVNVSATVAQHMYGGSISQDSGDQLYSGLDIQVTSPNAATRPIVVQDGSIITDYWNNAYNPDPIAGNIRILVETRNNGADVDGKRVTGLLRELGDSYFSGSTTLGTASTALALFSSTDGNNQTAAATLATYTDVTVTEGFQTLDHNNGNGAREYYQVWDAGTRTKAQAYERTKWVQRRGTAETLHGINASIFLGANRNFAHDNEQGGALTEDETIVWGTSFDYDGQTVNLNVGEVVTFSPSGAVGRILYIDDNGATGTMVIYLESGTPADNDAMTGVTSGGDGDVNGAVTIQSTYGTGLLLAYDDDGTDGNCYFQLLTGVTPVDNQIVYGATSNNSVDVNGTVATRTINNNFIGVFTGSDFQTNYGIAWDNDIATAGDIFRDLADTSQSPPNNQTGQVTGVVVGDYVVMYAWDGITVDVNGDPAPDTTQQQINGAVTQGVSTTIVVDTIPANTPQVGSLRIDDGTGQFLEEPYTSHNGSTTYNLPGTALNSYADNADCFSTYFDGLATGTTASYVAVAHPVTVQDVGIKVLRGGGAAIKPFPSSAQFGGGSGFSVPASRITDV